MKRLLCFAIAVCSYFVVVSQPAEKIDVVFKTNGDQLKGQVVEVTDDNIRFKYTGEQVIYTFKKEKGRMAILFRRSSVETGITEGVAGTAFCTGVGVLLLVEVLLLYVSVRPLAKVIF